MEEVVVVVVVLVEIRSSLSSRKRRVPELTVELARVPRTSVTDYLGTIADTVLLPVIAKECSRTRFCC